MTELDWDVSDERKYQENGAQPTVQPRGLIPIRRNLLQKIEK